MQQLAPYGPLFARILLALIFLLAGISKIGNFSGTQAYMVARGMPATTLLLLSATVIEIGGGLSILLGYKLRLGALLLFLFLIPTTLIFHTAFGGSFPPEQAQLQQAMLLKNLAIMGGLLAIAAQGAGAFSLDNRRA
ncbi:MAG TPA: DoxX family protein [Candidatus Binatia bacterium]|jgi:putative oxidoreductase|nr:DoxX family protein [Candidatus Binatia bacterium]